MKRRSLIVVLLILAALIGVAGDLWFGWLRKWTLAAPAEDLLQRDWQQHRIERERGAWWGQTFTDSFAEQCWHKVRTRMLQTGTKPAEVDGVLRAVQNEIARREVEGHSVFVLPAYARPARIWRQRVWVFGLGWEGRQMVVGTTNMPGHVWYVVVSARPPYPVVGQQSCR
jgi:hypothetical protein